MDELKLRQYFNFDETDLQANRNGQLTDKQKARFATEDKFYKKLSLVGGLVLWPITIYLLVSMLQAFLTSGMASALPISIMTVVGIIPSFLLIKRLLIKPKLIIAKAQGQANIVDAKSYFENNRVSIHQELQIGGKRFMGTTLLASIIQGADCCVYYIDRTKEHPYDQSYLHSSDDILSVEAMTNSNIAPAQNPSNKGDDDPEIIACLKKGDMTGAIRRHRAIHNSTYEEAKKAVEMLKAERGY